jgi:hypothetical protein
MRAKYLTTLACCLLAGLMLTACGKQVKQVDNEALEEEFAHAPAWVLDGYQEEAVSGVGSAKIGKGGIQFARTEALAKARDELARQVSVKVKSLVNNFVQQAGLGDAQMADSFSKQVTKQVTNETLAGSKQRDMWISPSSEIYVLVVMEAAAVKATVKQEMVNSLNQESARWQEYQAKNGEAELDREIERAFGGDK